MLKFFYNGIKANGGKLQKAHYSFANYNRESGIHPASITVYARNYDHFSVEVAEAFNVENNTDTQTDYFQNDRIHVSPDHPLYAQVLAAYDQQQRKRGCSDPAAERADTLARNQELDAYYAVQRVIRTAAMPTAVIQ